MHEGTRETIQEAEGRTVCIKEGEVEGKEAERRTVARATERIATCVKGKQRKKDGGRTVCLKEGNSTEKRN